MKSEHVNKDAWVAMFRDIGLSDAAMVRWHRVFEARNPAGHQEFLEWLGIPAGEIAEIRAL